MTKGRIRIGVGGWSFAPWRKGEFYPADVPQKRELDYMSSRLSTLEINATYRGSQKPESFAKWRDQTPDDFVFSVKGPMFATNRRALRDAAPSVEKFFASGVTNLGAKLGPINWQFLATKKFEARDFEDFLDLLPQSHDGVPLRHAIEARNESFLNPEFVELVRSRGVGIVTAVHPDYPQLADLTADFAYVRLQAGVETEPLGYSDDELDRVAETARQWAAGEAPEGHLHYAADPAAGRTGARDVFIYIVGGHKVKNPAAALALMERLEKTGG